MGLARITRIARILALGIAWLTRANTTALAEPVTGDGQAPVVIVADRDDDDANGVPDGEQSVLPLSARKDLLPIGRAFIGATLHAITGGEHVRVVAWGKPLPWSNPLPPGAMLQGLSPGVASIVALNGSSQASLVVHVLGAGMRDGARREVDLARDHASLERSPPSRAPSGPDSGEARYDDPDALRVVLEVPAEAVGKVPLLDVQVESVSAGGASIDVLRVGLVPIACGSPGFACAASAPLRFVIDEVDQKHPLVRDRSLRAEIGGAIVVLRDGKKVQAIRVLGPRSSSAGPIGRLRANIRASVVRVVPGGAPAIGGTDAGAVALLRGELSLASAIWGQCGVTFGPASEADVRVIDPPPSHLIAFGDDLGLPATGGEIRFRVDRKEVDIPIARGTTPSGAADAVARAIERLGLVAVVSSNARIAPGANGSVDVSVRRRDGQLVAVELSAAGAPLSTDASLVVRIGSVDLSDGLQHFGDMDSVAGTLEERTLLKAHADEPSVVDVVVVPLFAGGGRIGESFIASDLSSVRNAVILDRAGIRARRSSLTLAHELGHVLMDLPGHPDDYGVDTPTLLMDSDGSDASPFGPRRLTVEECARVVRQAGPKARLSLLRDWPLVPIPWRD